VTHPLEWKIGLAVRGARLDDSVRLPRTEEPVRSLDVVLPGDLWIDVSLEERQPESAFTVVAEQDRYFVVRRENGAPEARIPVRTLPRPGFYDRRTSRGTPMRRIAAVRGTHLLVAPTGTCGFSVSGAPCRFCVEGARAVERDIVSLADVLETVRAAFDERVCDLVWFNTSRFESEDGGIGFLAPYVEAVRRHFDTLVAVQVHPPRSDRWIDQAYALGVDAISYNLEIFDPELLKRHCIGRARYIGRERYLEALAHAARIFPSGTVWTDLALGLEPSASTIAGIDALVAMGVVPVVTLVRGDHPPPVGDETASVLAHLYRAVKQRGINMGWVRGLGVGITPLEARHFAGDDARLAVTVQQLARSRLGGLAARGLARVRRRLRVRTVGDAADSVHAQ